MTDLLFCVAGYFRISPQMFRAGQMMECERRANDEYAWTGARSKCVCGQHDGDPPISPLLLDDE